MLILAWVGVLLFIFILGIGIVPMYRFIKSEWAEIVGFLLAFGISVYISWAIIFLLQGAKQ